MLDTTIKPITNCGKELILKKLERHEEAIIFN